MDGCTDGHTDERTDGRMECDPCWGYGASTPLGPMPKRKQTAGAKLRLLVILGLAQAGALSIDDADGLLLKGIFQGF